MCRAGADYRRGDQHPNIAIVGACPGAEEEREGRPFIGDAGTHLAVMVGIINGISPAKFPSATRDDYTLLNAHSLPRYKGRAGYDGNTEPSQPEVMQDENIARLTQQLQQTAITRVLLAGLRPKWLMQTLIARFPAMEIFVSGHPSISRWNRLYIGRPRAEKISQWTHDTFQMEHPFRVDQ